MIAKHFRVTKVSNIIVGIHVRFFGLITLSDKQSISTLESESVAAVAMLNNALAGRKRSASDVSDAKPSIAVMHKL